jgi:inosine/xanthosine triphosphate pyrophosphatase family protein
MAELPADVKNQISHRRAALNDLLRKLEQEN